MQIEKIQQLFKRKETINHYQKENIMAIKRQPQKKVKKAEVNLPFNLTVTTEDKRLRYVPLKTITAYESSVITGMFLAAMAGDGITLPEADKSIMRHFKVVAEMKEVD